MSVFWYTLSLVWLVLGLFESGKNDTDMLLCFCISSVLSVGAEIISRLDK